MEQLQLRQEVAHAAEAQTVPRHSLLYVHKALQFEGELVNHGMIRH